MRGLSLRAAWRCPAKTPQPQRDETANGLSKLNNRCDSIHADFQLLANLHSRISQSRVCEWKILPRNRENGAQQDLKFQFVQTVALAGAGIEASRKICGGQKNRDVTME
jgi:hypothetical protein